MVPLLLLILSCILLMYYYWTRLHTYWLRRNVPCPKFSFFGNNRNASILKITIGESLQTIYRKYEGYPFVGIYELATPVFLLRDPKLIKCILVKDFACFQDRGILINEHTDPLSAHLINLDGPRWRILRTSLTSAFTISKTRHVFELITEVSEQFKQFVDQYADNEDPVEFRNLAAKFASEIMASCYFGLKTNTIQNDDSEFQKMCKKIMDPSFKIAIKRYIRDYMPKIFKWLSISLASQDVTAYFTGIVKEIITHRQMNNITRNDIMQILIDLKYEKTKIEDTLAQNKASESNDIVIDDRLITAQAFIFLVAGDTPSGTISFAMYELAANSKLQEKLYDEIRTVYEKHGCFSYDIISEMKYLDCVVRETLRKYPPTGVIHRVCGKSYKIPDSDIVLEKGTKVLVPIYAIHHDPLYYKNPDTFDPDRFIENKKLYNDTYLPFGNGPRICIGMKLGYIIIKVFLITLMANYKVELSEKTAIPLQFVPNTFTLRSKSGIWLRIRRRFRNASMLKITVAESLQMIYREYERYPFVGIYELATPVLLLRDPKLIKCILVKDFACFQSRGIAINEHADPLSAHLINLDGQRWRKLRTKLTSAFTTSKTRHVFELIKEVSEKFKQFVDQYANNEEPVEIRNLTAKFTSEIIATCFFGLKINTIQNDDSEFRKICKKIVDPSLEIAMKRYIRDYMPGIFKWLSVCLTPRDVTAYFTKIVKEIITHRQMNNITRNDIMQTLIDLKYKETKMENVLAQNETSESNDIVIDDMVIAAQSFIFFLAGFETSSTTMSFTMYELAANPKIQEKLYDEIRAAYEKHGCFSYDIISEMKYLDCVVRETLRKYPPVGATQRICAESYKIPDSDVVLEKGTKVLVPIYAIHHDPLYYKNPNIFDPDRFIDENKKLHDNDTYLPFGNGPRICIGMKFAYVQTKVGLVTLVANYKAELSEKTAVPLQFEPTSLTLTSKSGIWLRMRRRLHE
ncbi:cytochrome P450 6B7-like [Polyergus mexicanus]|uniref:cytochrome P450 6B7-like n=1 Tax=Polyergus mexicanus TaxID=615972 RepID=UPI0038B5D935